MRISVEPLRQHREKMIQISLRVQSVRLGGFQQGEDDDAGVGPRLGIAEQPVLPAHNNGPDCVLHLVVADFNLPMAEERTKILLLVEGVDYRFLQLACRLEDRLQPGVVFVDNGSGKKLALLETFLVCQLFQPLFHFKEPAAVFQSFRRQGVLFGCALWHGFYPFSPGVRPAACPSGSAQNSIAAVAI